ncbi:G patch domain and KOW motifs-containing protein [Thelohanellus kitauei]|uniref:G patch domain and KOW motifs-containing protein n=1 Tax=Thelohanellus kitauei TaxID=669202 RepID=A0A0C2NE21_THEKT|nr:G patch domain and KOW motifs-containing protein [Thelohanellus kitauei]
MNIKKIENPVKFHSNLTFRKISVFVDGDEEEKEDKKFVTEFGKEPPKDYKVSNEKPLIGGSVRSDLKSRPEEVRIWIYKPSINEYRLNPVHDFGTNLLKNMGWVEGKPIGLTNKGLSQPIEYIRRPERLGLGAESQVEYLQQKSELLKKRKTYTGPIAKESGKVKHFKGIHEQPHQQCGPKVKIVKGKYNGRTGTLISVDKTLKTGKIRLDSSDEIIILNDSHYMVIEANNEKTETKSGIWISPMLRVRIIDKKIEAGQLYNVKGTIKSVSRDKCEILTDNERTLKNVKQCSLETIVPKQIGSTVMIVSGKHQGKLPRS